MKLKNKMLIVGSGETREVADALKPRIEIKQMEFNMLEMVLEMGYEDYSDKNLPRGYLAYFLHPTDVCIEDLRRLRNEQEWSWIGSYGGRIGDPITDEKRRIADNSYFIPTSDTLIGIIGFLHKRWELYQRGSEE